MNKKGIQIKLKIHFTIKNKVQIVSVLGQIFAALAMREYSLFLSWFTSLKRLILLKNLSASVLSSSVLHRTIPSDLDEEYQPLQ